MHVLLACMIGKYVEERVTSLPKHHVSGARWKTVNQSTNQDRDTAGLAASLSDRHQGHAVRNAHKACQANLQAGSAMPRTEAHFCSCQSKLCIIRWHLSATTIVSRTPSYCAHLRHEGRSQQESKLHHHGRSFCTISTDIRTACS